MQATPELIAQIRPPARSRPAVYVQFWRYIKGLVLHFDLGYSYQNNVSVRSELFTRLPVTVSLTAGAFVVWILAWIPVGIISAMKPRSLLDRTDDGPLSHRDLGARLLAGADRALSFSTDIGPSTCSPAREAYTPLSRTPGLVHLVGLPWFVLAAGFAALYARMVRGNLIDVLGEDYIRTARAKGLSERRVVFRHGLRSALTPS